MKTELEKILEQVVGTKLSSVRMSFGDSNWRDQIPAEPGWYSIKTNTPIQKLKMTPAPEKGRRYNIAERVEQNEKLTQSGLVILQEMDNLWTVYNGHRKDLKARSREHESGHRLTGCLAIGFYDNLTQYEWWFEYFPVSKLEEKLPDSPTLRNVIEQAWRSKFGWPMLCLE